MANSAPDNKINLAPSDGEAPEVIDWDNVAIAVPHEVKTRIIVAARNRRTTVSEWGRTALMEALERAEATLRAASA